MTFWRKQEFDLRPSSTERELSNEDIVIVVTGATGTGKSTFIQMLTGKDTGVSNSLEAGTASIRLFSHQSEEGKRLILVDTPGFDDARRTDGDILVTISSWLAATYHVGILPKGILFFQRVTDNRMSGATATNLNLVRQICGPDCMANLILVTTMWDLIELETGEERERVLCDNFCFWKPLLSRGAHVARFKNTRDSAFQVLKKLDSHPPRAFQIQQEMVDKKFNLSATAAGSIVDRDLELRARGHESHVRELGQTSVGDHGLSQDQRDEEMRLHEEAREKATEGRRRLTRDWWRRIGRRIRAAFVFRLSL